MAVPSSFGDPKTFDMQKRIDKPVITILFIDILQYR